MRRPSLMGIVGLAAAASIAAPAHASPQISQKAGCAVCHAPDKKGLGPSYQEIARKYKGRGDAAALLAERVRKGSQGVWGTLPMPPSGTDKLSDAELKAVVSWLLKTP